MIGSLSPWWLLLVPVALVALVGVGMAVVWAWGEVKARWLLRQSEKDPDYFPRRWDRVKQLERELAERERERHGR